MTLEECRAMDSKNINFLNDRLQRLGLNFLGARDSKWRNILHKLMHIDRGTVIIRTDYVAFIRQVIEMFLYLLCQKDIYGDTPLHILVRNSFNTMLRIPTNMQPKNCELCPLSTLGLLPELLELCYAMYQREEAHANMEGNHYDPPWLMQNEEGNTPLHEALIADSDTILLRKLLNLDIEVTANLLNKRNETPLHLLAGRSTGMLQTVLCFDTYGGGKGEGIRLRLVGRQKFSV